MSLPSDTMPDARRNAIRTRMGFAALLVLAPVCLAAWTVVTYGVNVPFWDEWSQVVLVQRSLAGALTLSDLLAQHNEHRILFPRIALLLLGRVTGLDMRAGMLATLLCLVLAGAVLLRDHLREHGATPRGLLTFVPISLLLFSLRQWENLIWSWQLAIALCALAAIVAFRELHRGRVASAIAAGVIASFSFSNGLLVWPAGLLQLAVSAPPRHRRALVLWSAAAALTAAIYFHGYVKPGHHPSLGFIFGHPREAFAYLFASMGMPVALSVNAAVTAGCFVLLLAGLTAWALLRGRLKPSPSVALVAFALSTSAILMLGRAGFGAGQALSSRYATLAALGFIGLYSLLLQASADPLLRWPLFALIAVVAGSSPSVVRNALGTLEVVRGQRLEAVGALRNLDHADDAELSRLLNPDAPLVRAEAAFLRREHLSIFK